MSIIDLLRKNFSLLILLFSLLLISSCEQKSEYERLVQRELDKGVRYDSLFLGYKFGMEKEEFFDHSWKLNQQHIITGGNQVEYDLDSLSHSAQMIFFPEFQDNKIYRMPVEINYKGWAPWNKHLFSDSLVVDLKKMYEKIYGPGFIKTTHPENGKESWIKIDGNRRIAIYREDDMRAGVEFLDLSVGHEK